MITHQVLAASAESVGLPSGDVLRLLSLIHAPPDLRGMALITRRLEGLLQGFPRAFQGSIAETAAQVHGTLRGLVSSERQLEAILGAAWLQPRDPGRPRDRHPFRGRFLVRYPAYCCLVDAAGGAGLSRALDAVMAIYVSAVFSAAQHGKLMAWGSAFTKSGKAMRRLAHRSGAKVLLHLGAAQDLGELCSSLIQWREQASPDAINDQRIVNPLLSFLDLVSGNRTPRRQRGGRGAVWEQTELLDGEVYWELREDANGNPQLLATPVDCAMLERFEGLVHPGEAALGDVFILGASSDDTRGRSSEDQRWQIARSHQYSCWAGDGLPPSLVQAIGHIVDPLKSKVRPEWWCAAALASCIFHYGRHVDSVANGRFALRTQPPSSDFEWLIDARAVRVRVPVSLFKTALPSASERMAYPAGEYLLLPVPTGLQVLIDSLGSEPTPGAYIFDIEVATSASKAVAEFFSASGVEGITAGRLRSALRDGILAVSGDACVATMLTGQPWGPRSSTYYVNLPAQFLADFHLRWLATIGAVTDPSPIQSGHVGCEGCISVEYASELIRELRQRVELARLPGAPLRERHAAFTAYAWVALATGLALRAVNDPLPDLVGVYLIWDEKGKRRVLVLGELLQGFFRELERHRAAVARELGLASMPNEVPLLFMLEGHTPRALLASDLERLIPEFALPGNCFRKLCRTWCTLKGAHGQAINAWLSHGGIGFEPWGPASAMTMDTLVRFENEYIEPLLFAIGVSPLASPLVLP